MRVKQFRLEKGFKKPKLEAFEIKKLWYNWETKKMLVADSKTFFESKK
jgi:hypothetical protein